MAGSSLDTALILAFLISGTLVGITGYSIYVSFGASSAELRDPFDEHES